MRELNNLSDIYKNYETFVIDLWGVIHNGVALNPKAMEVIDQLRKNSKKIVFLSNAPRPSFKVVKFLSKMKKNRTIIIITHNQKYLKYFDNVFNISNKKITRKK